MATSSSSRQENPETKKVQFPLDPASYQILAKIGYGVSSVVYKAVCIMNSAVVAIKSIDLDQSRADFDSIRRETKTLSLLSHPNILSAHCSFTVDHHLWVVMPFMSAGSLQSIIFTAFPGGLPEPCIAVVLKETLNAMSYLHNQGHLHRDIKAGNILIDSDGSVKLADFGVSASVYEANSTTESSTRLTDITGTPYWMAPEVIHSHNGYGNKADIWSFGITALELAHGNPPLSNLPPSKSLLLKITKRFQFSDYETQNKDFKKKKFSKAFKDLVGSCLEQDQAKRPTAERLQRHPFFKNCRGGDSLAKNVLLGLPSVEERFKKIKDLGGLVSKKEEDDEGESVSLRAKNRRISGWNFNEDEFDLDPVFPTESSGSDLVFPTESFGDSVVKMVRFGGETVTHLSSPSGAWKDEGHMGANSRSVGEPSNIAGGAIEEETLATVGGESETGGEIGRVMLGGAESGEAILGGLSGNVGRMGGLERETMLVGLVALKRSLEEQRQNVMNVIGVLGGGQEGGWEVSREEQMRQETERLRTKLDNEREKNFRLEMELEFVRIQISAESNNVTGGGGTATD